MMIAVMNLVALLAVNLSSEWNGQMMSREIKMLVAVYLDSENTSIQQNMLHISMYTFIMLLSANGVLQKSNCYRFWLISQK